MKLFCKTLICKGVVKHKNERKRKGGKKEAHYNIYAHAYTRARKKKKKDKKERGRRRYLRRNGRDFDKTGRKR